MLEGELTVTFRGTTSTVQVGETINVPSNAPHQVHNNSSKTVAPVAYLFARRIRQVFRRSRGSGCYTNDVASGAGCGRTGTSEMETGAAPVCSQVLVCR